MIISASRRTDIPAFYGEWFSNRLKAGFVLVCNPFNPKQVRRVELNPEMVDCFVFWSKNPAPFLPLLEELTDYAYYFLFTLNPYGNDLEPALPKLDERIATFRQLVERIGPERVIWRYDPVLFTPELDEAYHLSRFTKLAAALEGHTRRVILSFLTPYRKTLRNLAGFKLNLPGETAKQRLVTAFVQIASSYGITTAVCCEESNLSDTGAMSARCVDPNLISGITGRPFSDRKDAGQRKLCSCTASVDIGAYDSCPHRCLYCYANQDGEIVQKNLPRHDPAGEFLLA
jgi:hypothetical protein